MTTISLIMPIHHADTATQRALCAVVGADQFIVVVDGEDERAVTLARTVCTEVITVERNSGPAAARNIGARAAWGDILFFVDSDVLITPQTLSHIRRAFADPALTALIGSYDDTPADPAFLSQYRNLLHHFTHQQSGGTIATFWGACGAVRRGAFLALGGFDEQFRHPSIEDIEFGYRLAATGAQMRLDPTLQVKHLKRWTAVNMLQTDLWRRAYPWSRLILTGEGFEETLNIKTEQRISVALAVLLLPVTIVSRRGSIGVVAALIWLNRTFYHFLLQKRGALFVFATLFWHWLYFLCSGVGFLLAWLVTRKYSPRPNRAQKRTSHRSTQ